VLRNVPVVSYIGRSIGRQLQRSSGVGCKFVILSFAAIVGVLKQVLGERCGVNRG